jgi:hypothetical protein
MLTTVIRWNGRQWMVELRTDGQLLAVISLDDWMVLPATQFAVNEASRQRIRGDQRRRQSGPDMVLMTRAAAGMSWEEEMELYRRMDAGPQTIYRSQRPGPVTTPTPATPPAEERS